MKDDKILYSTKKKEGKIGKLKKNKTHPNIQTMNTPQSYTRFTTLGCPGTRDGDIGEVVAPSARCSEIGSINIRVNPQRGESHADRSSSNQLRDLSQRDALGGSAPRGELLEPPEEPSNPSNPSDPSENEQDEDNNPNRMNAEAPQIEKFETWSELQRRKKAIRKKLGKKKGFKVASLNVKGKAYANKKSKYKDLSTLVRKNAFIVLAIQETKLKVGDEDKIMKENPRIHIESNPLQTGATAAGVGFVLNKELIVGKKWSHQTIIEGRASRLQMEWTEDQGIDLINIYAPNDLEEKISFYQNLNQKINQIKNWNQPILVGDFNCVEDAIDRFPIRKDDSRLAEELDKLKQKFNLIDGWRAQNEVTKGYTFIQPGTNSMARIDRIYTSRETYKFSLEWGIQVSAGISDHSLVYAEILKKKMPFIGKGLWKMYSSEIENPSFHKEAKKILLETQKQINDYQNKARTEQDILKFREKTNPQMIWAEAKTKLQEIYKIVAKERHEDIMKEKHKLERDLHNALGDLNSKIEARTNEAKIRISKIRTKLNDYESKKIHKAQEAAMARFDKEGEKGTKYYFALNKGKLPQQVMVALRDAQGSLLTETKKMSEIASNYHRELQSAPKWTHEREIAMEKMEATIQVKLKPEDKIKFSNQVTEVEVREAIAQSKNGTSPGIDGITYEFYKSWPEPKSGVTNENEPNITTILTKVYNDIETYGIDVDAFTLGVMFLLYKKKDKDRIENYRPLTLLNTDYKLLTKTIATKLGKVAKYLLHENQAGFVPGRNLYDNTRLSSAMIDYCEQESIEGCIVSLDQEKAYDKIAHDYLWRILRKNGFPEVFISLIKNLYISAKTTVMVNGVKPKPINIDRGVRQGDPMSCLLYDLAIEPFANSIRLSALKGLQIINTNRRVLVSLFADDTLVYLSKADNINTLKEIIAIFCTASTARFNLEKTEYLPVGPKNHRDKIIGNRSLNDIPQNTIEEGVTIIKDGEPMRTLGAWIGNGIDTHPQWNKILEKQKTVTESWTKMHPSYKAKEMIAKSLLQSRAMFLATVNGMPKDVMEKMKEIMKDFLWDGRKRGYLEWKNVIKPKHEGGLNYPDIESRLEAIQIIWLKKYLTSKEDRHLWTLVTDHIIFRNITKTPMVDQEDRLSWIQQTWHESAAGWNTIPTSIKEMLKVGRRFNIGIDALKINEITKRKLPIWHHIAVKDNYTWNKAAARCLKKNHEIKTVGQLQDFIIYNQDAQGCKNKEKCLRIANTLMGKIPEKFNPLMNTPTKDNLDHTPRRIRDNKNRNITETPITFDPNITEVGDPNNAIRIFIKDPKYKQRSNPEKRNGLKPAWRLERPNTGKEITLYTDGSSKENGTAKARAGYGIWHEENSEFNRAERILGENQSNQRAELIAISRALQLNEQDDLIIKSDSKFCLTGIIERIKKWEDLNWLDVENKDDWKLLTYRLRKRTATTSFQWVKGHNGDEGNENADKLANEGMNKDIVIELNEVIPKEFEVQGARLSCLTQKTAYRLIIQEKTEKLELLNSTKIIIEDIQDEIERATGIRPLPKNIWLGLHKRPIANNISDFIWKMIHNRIRCGKFFLCIPGWEEKAMCQCGEVESPEHIMIHCKDSQIGDLWEHVEDTWNRTSEENWISPSLGIIRGLGSIKLTKDAGDRTQLDKNLTDRYKIYVSEAIWVIWKDRNRRVFDELNPSHERLITSWNEAIKRRILIDWNTIRLLPLKERDLNVAKFESLWAAKEYLVELDKKGNRIKINI
jgi:ribonuclease HI/exonuclease III/chemotaxis regulatin CheY-phosphate phosphatase CheZ